MKLGSASVWLLATSFLLTAGCSHTRLPTEQSLSHPSLQELKHWSLRARVSVVHGEDSWNGSLRWQHLAGGDELTVRDPIGRTRLRASSQSETRPVAQLEIAGQPLISGPDLSALLHSATNLHLPFQQLPSWVTGRQSPGQTADKKIDPQDGRITEIEQAGWTIQYPDYHLPYYPGGAVKLPRKILLHDNVTQIRLIITSWQLPAD